ACVSARIAALQKNGDQQTADKASASPGQTRPETVSESSDETERFVKTPDSAKLRQEFWQACSNLQLLRKAFKVAKNGKFCEDAQSESSSSSSEEIRPHRRCRS